MLLLENGYCAKKAADKDSKNHPKNSPHDRRDAVRLFFIVAITGVLLGWKKHTGGVIMPKSFAGK